MMEFFIISRKIDKKISGIFTDNSDLILDLGCGNNPGYHKSIKGRIICFDKAKTRKTHVIGDANFLPFKSNTFDKVVSINSFYYFDNPFNSIDNINKILKKNGKLVLVTPFIYPIHDAPFDKYRFTEYGIREVLKSDFEIKEIKPIGGIFNLPAVFFHSLIKGIPLLFPSDLRKPVRFLSTVVFYPFYLVAQIISTLDFIDRTGRWATYYFVVAIKK